MTSLNNRHIKDKVGKLDENSEMRWRSFCFGPLFSTSACQFKSLSHISLEGAGLGEGMGALAVSLRGCTYLRYLNLMRNRLGPTQGGVIGDLLSRSPCMCSCIVGHNNLGDVGASALTALLPARLTCLDLSHNSIRPGVGSTLASNVSLLCGLESLRLDNNFLTPAFVEGLFGQGVVFSRLQRLSLNRNPIGDKGFEHISKCMSAAVCGLPLLESLLLARADITGSGALSFLTQLPTGHTLSMLGLHKNEGIENFGLLGEMCQKRTSPVTLGGLSPT